MVKFTTALVLAFIHATTALPSSSSLDGMSTPAQPSTHGHKDPCCLLSPDADVVYESNCVKLSTYEGVDSYSCPDVGEIEYKYNVDAPAHSQVRVSPNVGQKNGMYIHGWCEDPAKGIAEWTPVAYCPASVEHTEPTKRPFLPEFSGCKEPEFRVVSYLGHHKCGKK